jgi:hypothetical protein
MERDFSRLALDGVWRPPLCAPVRKSLLDAPLDGMMKSVAQGTIQETEC